MSKLALNEMDQFAALLVSLGMGESEMQPILNAMAQNPKWLSSHLSDLAKIVAAFKASAGKKAICILLSDPDTLRLAPPYLIGELKTALSNFNSKTHQWKDAQ